MRELLARAAAQAARARKSKLDAGRVDTVFKVGYRMLLRTKELDAADIMMIGKLRPRWDGPLSVTACRPGPNAYTLLLPSRPGLGLGPGCSAVRQSTWTASSPFSSARGWLRRPRGRCLKWGRRRAPGEHEVELLLNRTEKRGVTRYLVRWRGHTPADDEWLRAEELLHCPEKVAEYDAAAPRSRAARRVDSPVDVPVPCPRGAVTPPAGPAPLVSPAGYRVALATEVRSGKALVGQWMLYSGCWPAEGWVRGRVVRVSRAASFSHVVGHGPTSALGAAAVASLLDAASRSRGPVDAAPADSLSRPLL